MHRHRVARSSRGRAICFLLLKKRMTVDPFGPTQLNQPAWELVHAKETRFLSAFRGSADTCAVATNRFRRLRGLTQKAPQERLPFVLLERPKWSRSRLQRFLVHDVHPDRGVCPHLPLWKSRGYASSGLIDPQPAESPACSRSFFLHADNR